MTEVIADVAPPELDEVTSMVVWPSIGATSLGRLVGRMAGARYRIGRFFTLGRLLAVVSIPLALVAFAWKLMPFAARRYRLTNRRIVIHKGLSAAEDGSVDLDEFDAIEVQVLPGQQWLRAGELIFRRGDDEVFLLSGVGSPESFRHTCLEARTALLSVREVLQRQQVASA
jgi:hypothetical protein